jgi:hypothetical protein
MIELYRRLIRDCKTVNQINRVHIALENRLTPLEISSLSSELNKNRLVESVLAKISPQRKERRPALDSKYAKEWLAKLDDLASHSGKKKPEPFVCKRLSRHSLLFSDPSIPSKHKTLAVCFTGASRRMMMPTGVWLQYLDAKRVDVVLIIYPQKSIGYRRGLRGVGEDFSETLSNLSTVLPASDYARTVAIGTSGGAVPALLAAIQFNYSAVLAVGINSPFNEKWHNALGFNLRNLASQLIVKSKSSTAIKFVHGFDHEQDKMSACAWQELLKTAEIISIRNDEEPVGHLALRTILKSGDLSQFLAKTLNL